MVGDGCWYDEIFDDSGRPRPAYRALRWRTGHDPLRPATAAVDALRERPLGDDTRILPVPLVLDDASYRSVVAAGVAQRAAALQELFADLICGPQRVLSAGLGLDRDLVEAILATEHTSLAALRQLWRGHHADEIRFVYGPDLVRDPHGNWLVLEDNVGCVGGSADGFAVTDRYRDAVGIDSDRTGPAGSDLAVALTRWQHLLGREAPTVAVLGCDSSGPGPWSPRLEENARRRLILDAAGVPVTGRDQIPATGKATVANFAVDASWEPLFDRPGVALLNAPGTGVLGNKALLPYLDDLVRFYTGADPILTTPTTRLLTGALPGDLGDWVVKTSTGCQGSEVFLLAGQPADRLAWLSRQVREVWAGPAAAVAQRRVEPSRLAAGTGGWDAWQVELRPVSYVLGWKQIHVADRPVGKAVSIYDSRRLANVSQGACYVPVLRERIS